MQVMTAALLFFRFGPYSLPSWYGSGIPIRILRKDPQRCQYNPPSQPQPDGSAAGDRMDSEDNDSNIPSASGGGECSSSYGYEAYQGKVKEKGRAGSTSSKPYPSLETKHHAEGDREEGDRGGEPEVVEQADFVRKMEQEGRGSEDAVCRNDADTDVPIISQPRHSRHAGGDIDDEVELTDFSITSRKRFRESAGRAQDQGRRLNLAMRCKETSTRTKRIEIFPLEGSLYREQLHH